MKPLKFLFISSFLLLFSCNQNKYDLIIKNGLIFDGNGTTPISADIALKNDTIAFIGNVSFYSDATEVIDAKGMAVAPGFVNMLSWSTESLIEDGRSMGDIMQGVTLEVMGEGDSMGPISESMKADATKSQRNIKYDIPWNTLGEYLS